MHIAAPVLTPEHPDRRLACEEALHQAFYAIASADSQYPWAGDEASLWPLRKAATATGWDIDEVDSALARLAGTVRNALEPGRAP